MMIKKLAITFLMLLSAITYTHPAMSYSLWKDGFWKDSAPSKPIKTASACRSTNGVSHCSECQCADPTRHLNNCISDARFCEAFGNPGGR